MHLLFARKMCCYGSTVLNMFHTLYIYWQILFYGEFQVKIAYFLFVYRLIEECWSEDPFGRPTFKQIIKMLDNINDQYARKRRHWKVLSLSLSHIFFEATYPISPGICLLCICKSVNLAMSVNRLLQFLVFYSGYTTYVSPEPGEHGEEGSLKSQQPFLLLYKEMSNYCLGFQLFFLLDLRMLFW